MVAGSNDYIAMHGSYADGYYNNWTAADTPYSMAYWQRKDNPTLWDIVDGFTVADMYHQSILAPTDPNRVIWMSGSINVPGSPSNPNGTGGAMLDNTVDYGESSKYKWTEVGDY